MTNVDGEFILAASQPEKFRSAWAKLVPLEVSQELERELAAKEEALGNQSEATRKYASEVQQLADIIFGSKNVTAPFREVKERTEWLSGRVAALSQQAAANEGLRAALEKASGELQAAAANFATLTRGTGSVMGQLIVGHPFEERAMDAAMDAIAHVHNLRTRAEPCANPGDSCTLPQPPADGSNQ